MSSYLPGPAFGPVHHLAEGPRWDDARQQVSWVDITRGRVYRGELTSDGVEVTERLDFADTVGAASPTADGGFVVAAHDRIVIASPDGTRRESAPVVDRTQRLRLNDAAVDPRGRLLVGSLATDGRTGAAGVFRIDASGSATTLRAGMNLANGIGWSPDGTVLYAADSVPGVVWSARYDADSGQTHGWVRLVTEFGGLPDGLAVDTEGRLWVAIWGGAQVRCYAPSGRQLATVDVPAPNVTAVAFAGPARDQLLITTARDELDPAQLASYPDSGRMFLAQVHAVGLPSNTWHPPVEGADSEQPCGAGWRRRSGPARTHRDTSTPETT